MKATRIPTPPPPPAVSLELTEPEAQLLLQLSLINVSIPDLAHERLLNRHDVFELLDNIHNALRKVL